MNPHIFLAGKRIVVMGLGVFGGGIATVKWLLANGADAVTVTDLRNEQELAESLSQFSAAERARVTWVLGRHRTEDFSRADIVIVNPAVPRESPYLTAARSSGAAVHNDTSLFFLFVSNPIIGVTGTRGKTTTTHWIAHMISAATIHGTAMPAGNTPTNPLLKEIQRLATQPNTPAILELSSWQLELLPAASRAPRIAVITNLYPDHLNRYPSIEAYARAKANIFINQTPRDTLVLRYDNEWTPFFLRQKPKSRVLFFSNEPLPDRLDGAFVQNDTIVYRTEGAEAETIDIGDFRRAFGDHNALNLCCAYLAARAYDPHISFSEETLTNLATPPLRQETVYSDRLLRIINDSAATSPDALAAAIQRFQNNAPFFIVGGTDKELDFRPAAEAVRQHLTPDSICFLNGSGTKKLLNILKRTGFFTKEDAPVTFETLEACLAYAREQQARTAWTTLVFSPGAASFEKFKNEFHRGKMFNELALPLFAHRNETAR